MVELYSGTPGSGKSLHVAKLIYEYANSFKQRLVITNFEINKNKLKHPERIVELNNSDLKNPDAVVELSRNFHACIKELQEGNILLVLDECQLLFNARSWNEEGRKEWLSFFTQHRKLGFRVVLVTQFDGMLDKQIRSILEYETIHRKITNFGNFGFFLKLFMLWHDVFVGVEKWYSLKQRTGWGFFLARKRYYSLYDTFNTFNSVQ